MAKEKGEDLRAVERAKDKAARAVVGKLPGSSGPPKALADLVIKAIETFRGTGDKEKTRGDFHKEK